MPLHATLETHLEAALALTGFILLLVLLYVVQAVGPWTPPEVGVQIHHDIAMVPQILAVDFLGPKSLDILVAKLFWAAMLHALDFEDLPV